MVRISDDVTQKILNVVVITAFRVIIKLIMLSLVRDWIKDTAIANCLLALKSRSLVVLVSFA